MLKTFRSYQLAVNLYRDCEHLPVPGYLKDQLLRASLSVALNLAEGSAKPSLRDRMRFYGIAFASLRETQALLELKGTKELIETADRLAACLYRLTHPRHLPATKPAPG